MNRFRRGVHVFHRVNEIHNGNELAETNADECSNCNPNRRRQTLVFCAVKKPRASASAAIIAPNSSLPANELKHVRNTVSGCHADACRTGVRHGPAADRRCLSRIRVLLKPLFFQAFQTVYQLLHIGLIAETVGQIGLRVFVERRVCIRWKAAFFVSRQCGSWTPRP